jgi:uncharacterized protein YutE (UPF0331/DUF86 family)/predicted nucleotidyltransferase
MEQMCPEPCPELPQAYRRAAEGQSIVSRLTEYFATCSYPVRLAYLFGSEAQRRTTSLSDVDVAIYLDEPDPVQRSKVYSSLLFDLTRALGNGEVDLVFLNNAPPIFAYQIITGRLLYSAGEEERIAFEAHTLREYFDELVWERARHRLLRARILAGRMGERSREMLDERMINDRLTYIDAMLARLKSRRSLSLEEFHTDVDRRDATLYQLQTCIEAMTDIANHFVAALGLRKPRDRGDLFLILGEEDILDKTLAQRLAAAVGLRNVLVHGYLELVLETVYWTIQEDLGDIEGFCRQITACLGQGTGKDPR